MSTTNSLLRDLVALPSVNPMGRALTGPEIYEYQVTAYLENFFRSLGVPFERQAIAPLRDNIVARTDFPDASRTVIFEVHQDTVPTDHMTIAPFGATIENGRLYGRGACDIKGGMAAMLAAFARLVREKPRGAANVILACTVDEEHTFLGVQRFVKDGLKADGAIIAEPTNLRIVNAHKGAARWTLETKGRSCHSSAPEQGINAIYRMGQLLASIQEYASALRASKADPILGPPSLSVGRIEGGTSVNTVPDRCMIEIDHRLLPGELPSAALDQFVEFLRPRCTWADYPWTCTDPWLSLPALGHRESTELVQRLGSAIDTVLNQHEVITVPYGTDASTIALAGIPAVVFGPGDIAQAHTKDEWVSLEEVEMASAILFHFACR